MEVAPSPIDVQDFQFKLHSKLKIFDPVDESNFKCATNFVAAASRYGLVFIGNPRNILEVVQIKTIESSESVKHEISNFLRRSILLPSIPTHLSLNCDQTLLAVVVTKNNCPCALIYHVASFFTQNAFPVQEIRLSPTPNVSVLETGWNPTIPAIYTACKEDGSLTVYELKGNSVDINEIPPAAGARCFSWSPKGKQIVVGSANGSLTQYKPDLKAVKAIPSPTLKNGPCSVVNVYWLSNYQFVAVYHSINNPESRPSILIVNSSKTGAVNFINYEDICYSYGTLRNPQYYIIFQSFWNVILVASANSMEVGVLGAAQVGESIVWQQWNQMDAARAELPLHAKNETFPLGFAFDTGIVHQLPWGENQSLPAMPMLHIISHYGILCSFNVINLKQGTPMICTPPEAVTDISGLSQFTVPLQSTLPELKTSTVASTNQIVQKPAKVEFHHEEKPEIPLPTIPQTSFQPEIPINLSAVNNKSNLPKPTFFAPTVTPSQPNLPGKTSLEHAAPPNISTKVPDPVFSFVDAKANTLNNRESPVQLRPDAENLKFQLKIPQIPPAVAPQQKINQPTPTSIITTTKTTPNKKTDSFSFNQTNLPTTKTPSTKEETNLNDNIYNNMMIDEISNFQREFDGLLKRCKNIKLNVGTDEEKNKLVVSADNLLEFYKELQDITESHVAEVHYLKQALIQSFAWYEDGKSRHRRFIDPNYTTLLVAQDIDPISEKQLADIQHLIYYIDSQLKLVDEFLDNQWADFQDSCKKHVRGKIEIPLMEPVYQTMVRINAILARQKYVLKDIAIKLKNKNKKGIVFPHMNVSDSRVKDISDIDVELRKLKIEPVDIFSLKYDKIIKTQKKFSKTKENKICSFFTNRQIFHVSPKKPKFSSSCNSSTLYNEISKQNLGNVPRAVKSLSFEEEKMNEFNDTVEANLSSSNIFTFSLDSGIKSTKEKYELPNVPHEIIGDNAQITPLITNPETVYKPEIDHKFETDFLSRTPTTTNTIPKTTFDFNKSIENATMKVQHPAPISIPVGKVNQIQSIKESKLDVGFNDPEKITLNFKNSTAKIIMSPSDTKTTFNFSQPKNINPNVSSTATEPKTKTENDKDLNNTFNFGSQLTFGQISTPKPKPTTQTNQYSLPVIPTVSNPASSLSSLFTRLNSTSSISIIPGTAANATRSSTKVTTTPVPNTSASKPSIKSDMTSNTNSTTMVFNKSSAVTSTPVNTVPSTNILVGGANKNPTAATSVPNVSPNTTSSSIFGSNLTASTSTTIFGSSTITPATTTSSVFGTNVTSSTTPTPLFESNVISSTTPGSIFETNVTPSITFSTPLLGSNIISTTNTAGSIFGSNATHPTTTSSSVFKSAVPSTSSTSIFGNNAAVSSTPDSIFGSSATITTTSIFGSNTTPSTMTSSLFGPSTIPSATSSSIFGNVTSSTSALFKGNVSTTNTASVFNTVTPVTTSNISKSESGSINSFVNNATPTTSSIASPVISSQPIGSTTTTPIAQMTSIFGANANLTEPSKTEVATTTSQQLSFGLNSTTSSQSTFSFGNLTVSALSPKTSSPTSSTFSFTLPTTSQQSIFGNSNNIFSKTPATASTFMGQSVCSPTQTQASTPFGQTTGNIFAQKPTTNTGFAFGQSGSSVFGNTATTSSVFGQNSNSLFTTPNTTSSPSIFRQSAFNTMNTSTSSTGSIFGQSAFGNSPTTSASNSFSFTQNAPSAFANPSNNIFASKSSFGQAPAFGQPAVFGNTTSTFGSPTSSANVFGGSSMQAPQSPGSFGGFGGTPTFGSPANFGQSAFGAPPSFGNSPSFGSPQKVFGSPGATNTFGGGAVQESSTFANLASQNTVGFGSLAQNQGTAPSPQVPQFSGGSQFSSWR